MNDERRRFSIADALLMIAGMAAGLSLFKMTMSDLTPAEVVALAYPKEGWSLSSVYELPVVLGVIATPFVAAWTPAAFLVQVLRPRPPWRRLRRRPGFVACLLATVVTTLSFVAAQLCAPWKARIATDNDMEAQVIGAMACGTMIVGAWVAMLLCRVWHPSPTWTDRLGRVTGAVWIALGAMSATLVIMEI